MSIRDTFDRFSRRGRKPDETGYQVPHPTRIRVVKWCDKTFAEKEREAVFWAEIGQKIGLRHPLEFKVDPYDSRQGPIDFLSTCAGERFLDFIEDIFRVDVQESTKYVGEENRMVASLNEIFDIEELPYQLTRYHEQLGDEGTFGREIIPTYPRIILRESDALHAEAVTPAFELLREPGFENANEEYTKAHAHYLRGEYRDASMMATTALESVLKVICHQNNWSYNQNDAASKLIERFVAETALDGFFKQGLLLGPQIRNARSFTHGAGVQKKEAPKHMAHLALNLTASAILFIIEEARRSKK